MSGTEYLDLSSSAKETKTSLTGKVILGITGTYYLSETCKSMANNCVFPQAVLELEFRSCVSHLSVRRSVDIVCRMYLPLHSK